MELFLAVMVGIILPPYIYWKIANFLIDKWL